MNHNRFRIIFLIIMVPLFFIILANANKIDNMPQTKPEPVPQQVQVIKVTATAFNAYGVDESGIDYGPGYVIISDKSEIPINSLLDIDVYGPCQAIGVSDKLASNEIKLWYNASSKIPMFGTQVAHVKILGEGDTPCRSIK